MLKIKMIITRAMMMRVLLSRRKMKIKIKKIKSRNSFR